MSIMDFFKERKTSLDELAKQRKAKRKDKGRIWVKSHIDEVLDPKSALRLFETIQAADPLEFPGYKEKVAQLAKRSNQPEAFICATGTIKGIQVVCAELTPEFLMGSMGTAVGEAVCQGVEYALKHRIPLIIFSASGGARMQEGMFSLMQMAKTAAAIRRLSDAGILYISVFSHPTTGGVTASFASLGDIILAEPGALIGFAGPRVIEQTIRATLPEGFQRAEFQQEHGFVDIIAPRKEQRELLAELLALHQVQTQQQKPSRTPLTSTAVYQLTGTPPQNERVAFEHVSIARHPGRPHAPAFIEALFEGFVELHGDRLYGDDPALIAGIAYFEGKPITIAAHLKGSELSENIRCNFGMPHPEGYRKFIRLAKQAEKFARPIITYIDTPGAYPGAEAEERGQGEAIARCLFELSALKVPLIAIITGEGGSGGALALGFADRVYMYEYAIYSVLSPEGFASILWKDSARAQEASEVMKLTAQDLERFGMIDGIISEPQGGAHNDPKEAIESLRPVLRAALEELQQKENNTLVAERYKKYRKYQ